MEIIYSYTVMNDTIFIFCILVSLEFQQVLAAAGGQVDGREHYYLHTQGGPIQQGHPGADDALLFQPINPPPAGRLRHVDVLRQCGGAERGVLLQKLQDLYVLWSELCGQNILPIGLK